MVFCFKLLLSCIKYDVEFCVSCRKENKTQKRLELFLLRYRLLCGTMWCN